MSIWSDIQDKSSGETFRKEDLIMDEKVTAEELEKMLKQGIVHFEYRKKDKTRKDGTIIKEGLPREAWGTRMMDMNCVGMPHGGTCIPKEVGYIVYWDLKAEDWRVFWPTRLLGVCHKIFTEEEFNKLFPDGIQ